METKETDARIIGAKIICYGIVQGVGYRAFIYKNAKRLGIKGYVLNRNDGGVECLFIGKEKDIKEMIELARTGPSSARVQEVISDITEDKGMIDDLLQRFNDFEILY